jgi:hypothetical protein
MKLIKIGVLVLAIVSLSSCVWDVNLGHTNGNGNVVTEDREVADFTEVKGTSGIDVYLTEGNENKVVVEADENLMVQIETYVEDDRLIIRTEGSIGKAKAKKVYVTYTDLKKIIATSGADVIGQSIIKAETIMLEASSGADLEVEVFAKKVYAETSSGSGIKVSGKATSLRADASSGSDLNARNLLVVDCRADASSGADITVNVKEQLTTEVSSGADIKYYGNPSEISKNKSTSGSVRKM